MKLDHLDLVVRDVPNATAFFRNVLGLEVRVEDARYAEIDGGPVTIMLSPEALVPTKPAAGTILHFQVEDVAAAIERAQSRGAKVLMELTQTDWGWESAMIAGPEEIVIDLYRPRETAGDANPFENP
ncbi:MAG: VOC family protein [Chloroflexota bacterium]|nr:VOC family protein [Chloroflexota bacterium]